MFEWQILQFFVDAPVRIVPDKEQTVPIPHMACEKWLLPTCKREAVTNASCDGQLQGATVNCEAKQIGVSTTLEVPSV